MKARHELKYHCGEKQARGDCLDFTHQNYDAVFKEAMTLFQGKALDFLGLFGIAPITEPLRTESVEIEIKAEFRDLTFGTQDGRGLHLENEADLSRDDLLRFCSYNVGLSRVYKREFLTVVFVKNPTSLEEVVTEHLRFRPFIVQCSQFDADAILERLREDIAAGRAVNELEAIYLPLFRSARLSPTELFVESAALIKAMEADDNRKRKMLALLVVLAGKVADKTHLNALVEEVMVMGNVIIEFFEERGERRGIERTQEEIAVKMLQDNCDLLDIIRYTGIDAEHLNKLRSAMRSESAAVSLQGG